MSAWTIIAWAAGLVAAAAVVYGLHRLALWLEREGWIRYINDPPRADTGGAAMLGELQKIFEPQTQHVFEMKEQKRRLHEADGGESDPPAE